MSEENKTLAGASGGLDALFRKTLDNYQVEPSEGTWKSISRKLLWKEIARFNFTNLPKAFWAGAAGALLLGLVILFNQIPDGNITENDHSTAIAKNNPASVSSTGTSDTRSAKTGRTIDTFVPDHPAQVLSKSLSAHPSKPTSGSPMLASRNSSGIVNTGKINGTTTLPTGTGSFTRYNSEQQSDESPLTASEARNTSSYKLNFLPYLTTNSLFPLPGEDTLLRIKNLNGSVLNVPLETKIRIPQFFTYNVGVAPELSVYRNNGQYSESNFWLNTGVTYHIGKFSVQTGVGLGYVYDQADYRVNYKSKDSIGYFTSIVSFVVTPGNKIIFTTKDIAVYDSVYHVADNRGISRYTYLQIPLLVGYEVFETNRLSIGIKAGPSISFLIGSKEAQPFIDYPNAQLIRIDNNTLVRIKTNWEIQAALDIEYRLSKNFSVYADPSYRHYFSPFEMQESSSSKAKDPYSIGIEVGVRVNFGQIKK